MCQELSEVANKNDNFKDRERPEDLLAPRSQNPANIYYFKSAIIDCIVDGINFDKKILNFKISQKCVKAKGRDSCILRFNDENLDINNQMKTFLELYKKIVYHILCRYKSPINDERIIK